MTDTFTETVAAGRNAPSLGTLFQVFLKIGLLSFGGPAAQIALMHRLLVEELKWLTEQQYLNALSFCMLLPGPEAMQIATYAGWRLRGIAGGLIGGLLFVIPGAILILALAAIYALFGQVPLIDSLFLGVKSAVLLIVVEALLRVSKRALRGRGDWIVAGLAFAGIFILDLPYPLIVGAAALWGWATSSTVSASGTAAEPIGRSFGGTMLTVTVWLVIWWLPVLLIAQLSGFPVLTDLGLFFSKLAVVTFGGAYAVLAYMAQDVVGAFGWLNAGEMMDGLGLAETTPGPLILVTEFVGFLAAYRDGGIMLGIAGAALTLWVTFVPCFLWIFAGAPYIDWISAQPRLKGALSAITAAVVGVILNLSLWFGLHVMFGTVTRQEIGPFTLWQPELATFDWRVAVLAALSGLMLLRWHWGIGRVLAICAGLAWLMVNGL
ncbi:chromate efflux transporter [Nisaea nitritireducens]|uniref:chromate efflux transporter n=1 Tax=Nisaea nitritireducens TaxID=568392 RepID=UPI0018660705|nr:chromate efflux transporter [Nisaea nitritireducens]